MPFPFWQVMWATIPKMGNMRCLVNTFNRGSELQAIVVPGWFTDILRQNLHKDIDEPLTLVAPVKDFVQLKSAGDVAVWDHNIEPGGAIGLHLRETDLMLSPEHLRITHAVFLDGKLLWNNVDPELNTVKWPGEA